MRGLTGQSKRVQAKCTYPRSSVTKVIFLLLLSLLRLTSFLPTEMLIVSSSPSIFEKPVLVIAEVKTYNYIYTDNNKMPRKARPFYGDFF